MKYFLLCFSLVILNIADNQTIAQAFSGDSLFARAKNYLAGGKFDSAILCYRNCLDLSIRSRDSLGIGNALNGIGIAHDQGGRFDTALHYYFKALSFYEAIRNNKKTGGALKNIGNIYRLLGNFRSSSEFLQKALIIQRLQQDSVSIARVLNDIGLLYLDQQQYQQALAYFDTILVHYAPLISNTTHAYVLNNEGIIYAATRQWTASLNAYTRARELLEKENDPYGMALVAGNTGDLFLKQGKPREALQYHLINLQMAGQIKSGELLLNSYQNLAKTYEQLADYRHAYFYAMQLKSLRDSVFEEQRSKYYAEMEARYQNEKKQNQILMLQQENDLAGIRLENQRKTQFFLAAIALLILLIAAGVYLIYRHSRRLNRQLKILNERLDEANQSKTKLLSILSHDLRSPVSSLLHLLQLGTPGNFPLSEQEKQHIQAQIREAGENLLDTMEDLLLWTKSQMEHFTISEENVDILEMLTGIVQLNAAFASSRQVELTLHLPESFDMEVDPNFLRIALRNLVSNAIKFTPRGGNVILSAYDEGEDLIFSVQDTGRGMTEADRQHLFDWTSIRSDSSGLGLRLAKEFAEKAGAVLSVHAAVDKGTEFQIRFRKQSVYV